MQVPGLNLEGIYLAVLHTYRRSYAGRPPRESHPHLAYLASARCSTVSRCARGGATAGLYGRPALPTPPASTTAAPCPGDPRSPGLV